MAPLKRKKSDSFESPLELPLVVSALSTSFRSLQDASLSDEGLWKLRECLAEYRQSVDNLESLNGRLSRENECLKRLFSSVGSIWDVLNNDVDDVVSAVCRDQEDESICANVFVETLLSTQLPLCAKKNPIDDSDSSPAFTVENDCSGETAKSGTSKATPGTTPKCENELDEFVETHLDAFNHKKDRLLTHMKRLDQFLRESAPGRYPSDGSSDVSQQLDCERFKNRVLELTSRLLCDSVSTLQNNLSQSRTQCGRLEVEVSRLVKLTADLRHQLSSVQSEMAQLEAESERRNSSVDVTPLRQADSTDDGPPTRSVEHVEDVTTEMIIGSSLYSRLFDHAKGLDDEVNRLERENASLRALVENSAQTQDKQTIAYISKYEALHENMMKRIEEYEAKLAPCQTELSELRLKRDQLAAALETSCHERDQLLEELQQKDRRLQEIVASSAKISQTFALSSTDVTEDSRLADYQDQVQNIAQELEEISNAYEEKNRFSEALLQQVKESRQFRDKYSSMESALRSAQDKMNRMMSVYGNHIEGIQKQREESDRRLEVYRLSWIESFKRASNFEKQRNMSASALCESQSQYRRCFREKNELMAHIMQLKSQGNTAGGASLSSESMLESANSGLVDVMQENDVLRRRMTCTVCSENFRDQCITKCGHVFCSPCVSNNIKSRNRKCPVCKVAFDKSDIQRIFLD